jgi:hypothetical protein
MIETPRGMISCSGRKAYPCLADQTNRNTACGAHRAKPSVMAATISRPLTAIATIQPTNRAKRKCPTKTPCFTKRIRACICGQVWYGVKCGCLRKSRTATTACSSLPAQRKYSKKPPTTAPIICHGVTRNPAPIKCAAVLTLCRQYHCRAKVFPDLNAKSENSSSSLPELFLTVRVA